MSFSYDFGTLEYRVDREKCGRGIESIFHSIYLNNERIARITLPGQGFGIPQIVRILRIQNL